jgi:signal transduction histidine kinase
MQTEQLIVRSNQNGLALQDSQWWTKAQFRDLLDSLHPGVVVHGANTQIVYSNRAASMILGLTKDQLLGKATSDPRWHFLRDDGVFMPIEEYPVSKVFASRAPIQNLVIGVLRPDLEQPIWVICNAPPEFDEKNQVSQVVVSFTDITAERKLKQELDTARDVAEKAVLTKTHFLDVAAHELRTPITAFSLLLQISKKNLARGLPIEMSTLSRLQGQADRLALLVVELLDVSRLERGMVQLKLESVDLIHLLNNCLQELELRAPSRKILFLQQHDQIMVMMDQLRVFQVISNFLDNANKYTPADRAIEIKVDDQTTKVRIMVKDSGPGITKKLQEELFNPLTRGASEHEERTSGLGLGLYIARKIIELHGGAIGVESKLGEGSTFFFEIPKKGAQE